MFTINIQGVYFDDSFKIYKLNKTNHFYPSLFIKDKKLTGNILKKEDVLEYFKLSHKNDLNYTAIYKLNINKHKGYIWGYSIDDKVFIYLSLFYNNKFVSNFLIANYDYLESAFEKTINTLLSVKNSQIIINTIENLVDFEFETELSKNISGTKKYSHVVKKDKVVYNENIKFEITFKK